MNCNQKHSWHSLTEQEVFNLLHSNSNGLDDLEVAKRQEKCGFNRLPGKEPPTLFHIFLSQFKNPLIYILGAATIVSLVLEEYTDAIFIVIVLLINSIIGTLQEHKAEKSAAALHKMFKIMVSVKRNGKSQIIDAEQLVPGDIVMLESGNRVPADLRLLYTNQLQIDESLLTGESVAVEKLVELEDENTALADRKNMAYAGSTVTSGRAIGIVVQTGNHTEVGNIAHAVSISTSLKPPLVIRLEKFAKHVAWVVMAAIVILWFIGIAKGIPQYELFFLAVALAVSAIPEGLPIAVTVALSIGTGRMAKRNVIVRKLTAVEGLGSCTFIASDKTGTLTVNMQTVKHISLADGTSFSVSGEGYNNKGTIEAEENNKNYPLPEEFTDIALLCNEAELYEEAGKWVHHGDAMDVALIALAYKAGKDINYKSKFRIIQQIPFESERKYSAVVYQNSSNELVAAAKGASEVIIARCSKMLTKNGIVDINIKEAEEIANTLTGKGYRVLALAYKTLSVSNTESDDNFNQMTLAGFAGFIDPLRPEAIEAVKLCHGAGVKVAMVTGDHPLTAFSIAKELGIAENKNQVLTGLDLEKLGNDESPEFLEKLKSTTVFARVSPIQKMQIVSGLSKIGHFVAVTGDGVNDVPALKLANIGIAMGSGTDMAKETASIIVTDDNFKSIEAGIEEGRFAYDNIRKVVYLLVSTGAAEILLFFLAIGSGLPIPLTAIQLLWLNLVTNGIQDVVLAMEGGEPETMQKPPRKPTEGLFNRLMISQSLTAGASMGLICFTLWYVLLDMGYTELHSRTLVFMFMVLAENVHVFNCRSELTSAFKVPINRNYYILFGVLAAQTIHIITVNIPFMQKILESDMVSLNEWIWLFGLAALMLPIMELFKWAYRKNFLKGIAKVN
ncbi:MAG: cation-translocating P-type ATPase [Bacteroidia bacterium]